jgi:hypothetical protein
MAHALKHRMLFLRAFSGILGYALNAFDILKAVLKVSLENLNGACA